MRSLLTPLVSGRDRMIGSPDSLVSLVEYGDYECPACGEAHGIVKQIQRGLGDRLLIVFRNFPLSTAHPYALQAAQAAEASALQGRFWQMHDLLYENQQALEPQDLMEYAERLGLDLKRFEGDMTSARVSEHVHADFISGMHSGVNGTPTFFINGQRYDGSWSLSPLVSALEQAFEDQLSPSP